MTDNIDTIDEEIRRRLRNAPHMTAEDLRELAVAARQVQEARNDGTKESDRSDLFAKLRGYFPALDALVLKMAPPAAPPA